jgi:hypothetical protein
MAVSAVTSAVITRNAATAMGAFVQCPTNDSCTVDAEKDDQKICIHVKNAITNATHTAVIAAGNGLQGVADLEIAIAQSSEKVIVVESGAYKQISGDNKGKILIKDKSTTNTDAIQVAAVVLP